MRRLPMSIALLLTLASFVPASGCSPRSSGPGTGVPAAGRAAVASKQAATPPGKAATPEELERYAEREGRSAGLEKFEGGRIDTTAIIIILLLVIIIVLLV